VHGGKACARADDCPRRTPNRVLIDTPPFSTSQQARSLRVRRSTAQDRAIHPLKQFRALMAA
jgi:hypothetical protein